MNIRSKFRMCVAACACLLGFTALASPKGNSTGDVETFITARLAAYAEAFPQVQFERFLGPRSLAETRRLLALVGADGSNLDYEHTSDLRAALLEVNLQRVQYMLSEGEASASMYRRGPSGSAERAYVCALTLDPAAVAADHVSATRHMLPVSSAEFSRLSERHFLDPRAHLSFVIDHELYHCLDALFNGPIPMGEDETVAEFAAHRNEHGADAFAIAIHIKEHGRPTEYVQKMLRLRTLALVAEDVNHYTPASIRGVLETHEARVESMDLVQLFAYATRVRDRAVPDIASYRQYRKAAALACDALATPPRPGASESKSSVAEIRMTNRLFFSALSTYRRLFADAPQS